MMEDKLSFLIKLGIPVGDWVISGRYQSSWLLYTAKRYHCGMEIGQNGLSHFLNEGFEKGDTIAVFMENRPEFVRTWLGLAKIGVIPALINYNLRAEPLFHTIQLVKCKAVNDGPACSGHTDKYEQEQLSNLLHRLSRATLSPVSISPRNY